MQIPKELLLKRFQELTTGMDKLLETYPPKAAAAAMAPWSAWSSSAVDLLERILPPEASHVVQLKKSCNQVFASKTTLLAASGVFAAAKHDFESGYLGDFAMLVSGEVLGDFVILAESALAENYVSVAAVLASAALEDALKRYATSKALDVSGKVMQEVISALKSKGLVGGALKGLIDSMPKIRDCAMHADWGKLSAAEVSGMIGFIKQFVQMHFSS